MSNDFPVTVVIGKPDGIADTVADLSHEEALEVLTRSDERWGERTVATHKKIEAVRDKIVNDSDLTVEYAMLQRESARRDELLTGNIANIMRAGEGKARDGGDIKPIIERMDLIHQVSDVGSMLLYDGQRRTGASKFATVTFPNLSWWPYCFNDRTSSVVGWGVNWLFQHSWYGGRSLLVAGFPWVVLDDLRELAFDNMASSFVAVP